MIKPDAIFKCIQNHSFKTEQDKIIELIENAQYMCTTTQDYIFMFEYDNPANPLPWLKPHEFKQLNGTILVKIADL